VHPTGGHGRKWKKKQKLGREKKKWENLLIFPKGKGDNGKDLQAKGGETVVEKKKRAQNPTKKLKKKNVFR